MAPRGGSVDPQLIGDLAGALAPIGPDGCRFWVGKRAGLGHALLELPGDPPGQRQPCTLDGQVWITADVRLDGRGKLLAALKAAGRRLEPNAADAQLLLHSYQAWGESCVEHLLGDFAFALWDGRRDMLLCARDHFGVVPLYYAPVESGLIVSNVLDCVRLHSAVTDRLNETAVGDYLLFGCNQDLRTTFFEDVHKLPPAHAMSWSDGRFRSARYWRLPEAKAERFEAGEIIEGFVEVFRTAVEDRVSRGPTAVLMSGGLDSTTIATLASGLSDSSITAHVTGFSRHVPDEEPRLAASVAEALGIPIRIYDADAYLIERLGPRAWLAPPEPRFSLHVSPGHEIMETVTAEGGRVFLSGEGGDLALKPDRGRRLGWLPFGLRWALRRFLRSTPDTTERPFDGSWLDPDFARRMDLVDRWQTVNERLRTMRKWRAVTDSLSESVLSSRHAEFTGLPLVFRYPFFDVRLLSFLQSIPPEPWLRRKRIVRDAMRGVLPDSILERPKTPATADYQPLATRYQDSSFDELARTPELAVYVTPQKLQEAICQSTTVTKHYVQRIIYPLSLAFWLRERAHHPRLVRPGGTVEQRF